MSAAPSSSMPGTGPVCVITGSSVAAGWNATNSAGWAQKLGAYLETQGWVVHNVSKPGTTARQTIERFEEFVVPKKPTLVIVGLGLWNERINKRGRAAVLSLLAGLIELVSMARAIGAHVMLGGVYPNQKFGAFEYELLKSTHAELQTWKSKFGVPVFDFFTGLDDGTGHWLEGIYGDFIHPNDKGHQLMFQNIDLTQFEACEKRPSQFSKL